jgi:D-3-phosphoglycerate dehydrogenase
MAGPAEALILDLLEWIGSRPRAYEEVIDAWRTSCPRLPVWEDANDRGLVECLREGGGRVVRVTERGRQLLATQRPQAGA